MLKLRRQVLLKESVAIFIFLYRLLLAIGDEVLNYVNELK